MSAAPVLAAAPPQRVAWIDHGRGLALLAMIAFHFSYDLTLLGIAAWPVGSHWAWRGFAMAIAGTFIALSGVSLQLAAGGGLNRRAYLRRLAMLAGAAALVTLGTWTAMPYPVTFGILHAITLYSVLALPFLRAPLWAVLAAAGLVLAAPRVLTSPLFSHPLLYPLGLDPAPPSSFDYEPVFPWFAAMLIGLAAARVLPVPRGPVATDPLARMGRHSLVIYLLHQPILLGVLIAVSRIGLV